MFKVALCGNPNSGKTTLFNALTGSQAHVGNWPGVTVEKREGFYRHKRDFPEPIDIVDLPGIYSLSPYTPEEIVSRNFILNDQPDVVINVLDATNLGRNLFLTTQVLEMNVPVIIAINFFDIIHKRGDTIDIDQLSKKLGVPVVLVSALKGTGLRDLIAQVYALKGTKRDGTLQFHDSNLQETVFQVSNLCAKEDIPSPLFIASKLIEQDAIVTNQYPEIAAKANTLLKARELATNTKDSEETIANDRYAYISSELYPCYHPGVRPPKLSASDRADKILTNRWLGIPIFALIMAIGFSIVFDNDFLHMGAMGLPSLRAFYETPLPGIPSLGIFLQDSLDWILNTWFTGLVRSGLMAAGAYSWVTSLICDGILASVFAVISFLPLIMLLTVFIQLLENSGYMARVAFVFDRLLRKFGISGRCIVPLISCFGCAVPGIMGTRTIESPREKVLTISLTPFFACGAKLPIFMAIGTQIVYVLSGGAIDGGMTAFIMYAVGIIVAILAGYFSNAYVIQGESSPFIMEFPPYMVPRAKATSLAVLEETKKFLIRAGTIIAIMSGVIWFLQNFGWNWQLVPNDVNGNPDLSQSIISSIGVFIQPLFYPLGFVKGVGGWKYIVAAFTGIVAKEQVVATMESFGILGAGLATSGIGLTIPGAFSFLTFNLLTLPCIAAISTAKAELNSKRNFRYVLLFWLSISYIGSAFVYAIGSLSLIGTASYGILEIVMESLTLAAVVAIAIFLLVNRKRVKTGKEKIHLFHFDVEDPSQTAVNRLLNPLGSASCSRNSSCNCH
jgi:ferrous iron transport protein B